MAAACCYVVVGKKVGMMSLLAFMLIVFQLSSCSSSSSAAQQPKNTTFYNITCPRVFDIVNKTLKSSISKDPRMAASLLRLFFHDCFVNGCDGSVLLDDTSTFKGEKTAGPNNNSLRGFDVIDRIKRDLEIACPQKVSCADILAIAAMQSVVFAGGLAWNVELGRQDSRTASLDAANTNIPAPNMNLSALIDLFKRKNLSVKDLVVLSGAHTIGQAKCFTFRDRIYNDINIEKGFAKLRRHDCPNKSGDSDNKLAPLDFKTPRAFDIKYYQNLLLKKGLLHSDQELFNGGQTDGIVENYSNPLSPFLEDFAISMINMGRLPPTPSGVRLEIRKVCSKVN